MLTFFTIAKPFVGHSNVIQRNALKSWTLVHSDAEVILFGNDEGAAGVAEDLGIRHEPHTKKNGAGSNRMDYLFSRAQAIGRHDVLCYSNCDIIFMDDFCVALERVLARHKEFLMVGRRWDTEVAAPCDFGNSDWPIRIRELALQTNRQRTPDWIDYFVFSRDLFTDLPPLVVGRVFWDNLTVWKALEMKKPVVDVSRMVMVYHRTHMWRGGEEVQVDSHFSEVSGRVPESCVSLLRYSMVATSCLAFRRSALNKLLPVPEALRSQADAYLTALIIFVAPVTALPEFLAKYRLHGANLFHISEGQPAGDRIKHRLAMRAVLSEEIRVWLEGHGYDLTSPNLQAYLKQWTKAQELDGFALAKPSRWSYFRHLLEYPRDYGKIMSPRHWLYDYIRAFGALLLGYDRLYLLDDLRKAYKDFLGNPAQESAFSADKTDATGKN